MQARVKKKYNFKKSPEKFDFIMFFTILTSAHGTLVKMKNKMELFRNFFGTEDFLRHTRPYE